MQLWVVRPQHDGPPLAARYPLAAMPGRRDTVLKGGGFLNDYHIRQWGGANR